MKTLILTEQIKRLIINNGLKVFKKSDPNTIYYMNVFGILFRYDSKNDYRTEIEWNDIPIYENDEWCISEP